MGSKRPKSGSTLFLLAVIVMLQTGVARADASAGFLFGASDALTPSHLVLQLQGGGTVDLNNLMSSLEQCSANHCMGFTGDPIPNQGWYTNNMNAPGTDGGNPNYFAGVDPSGNVYRNFFTFDLQGLSGTVIGATLQLQRFFSGDVPIIGYSLGGVSGFTAQALNNSKGFNPAIFNALGAGGFGSFQVGTSGLPSDILSFTLNQAAIDALNQAIANNNPQAQIPNYFNIGGSTFDVNGPGPVVPEPASLVLVASGLAGVWLRRRK